VAVGSRGIARIADIVAALVQALHGLGARAVVVAAMGSHGGGTAEGQRDILASLGITEDKVGAPILTDPAVVDLGVLEPGLPIWFSRDAMAADGVIPVARIKPHTAFRGPVESGIHKMLVIGLGRQPGAETIHHAGYARFPELLAKVTQHILGRVTMPFAIAIVENHADEPALIEAVTPEDLPTAEPALLEQARHWMARLPFEHLDVLVVRDIGKNISGDSADPNVTGRYGTGLPGDIRVNKLVYLRLTPESHGNAMGVGMADIISAGLYQAIDTEKTYLNAITSGELGPARIPVVAGTEADAIELALRTASGTTPERARVAIIRNTLDLSRLLLSEALWEDTDTRGIRKAGPLRALRFDSDGDLSMPEF
jgi:hypothetical protein